MAEFVSHREISTTQRAQARRLRAAMTDAETKLWMELRAGRFVGARFRRQVPIGPYIADFCCHAGRLVVEVDGGQHGTDDGLERDRRRDAAIEREGYRVLRFWNHEVLAEGEAVLDVIHAALVSAAVIDGNAATPLPVPPPQGGRERRRHRRDSFSEASPPLEAFESEGPSLPVPSPLVGEGQGEGSAALPRTLSKLYSHDTDACNRGHTP